MANSDYSYNDVLNGTGYFSKSGNTGYSSGVAEMKGYLWNIGYDITVNGIFDTECENAVKSFQKECCMTVDGSAGPATLSQLEKVRTTKYFLYYGHPERVQWSWNNVLAGVVDPDDALARVIYGEYTQNDGTQQQEGIAVVLRNRKNAGIFYSSSSATDWAKVLCKGFTSVNSEYENSAKPPRGDVKQADGISKHWKNAVDLALKLYRSQTLVEPNGYAVEGAVVSSTTRRRVSTQLNFMAKNAYLNVVNDCEGNAVSMYPGELKGTIFFDY